MEPFLQRKRGTQWRHFCEKRGARKRGTLSDFFDILALSTKGSECVGVFVCVRVRVCARACVCARMCVYMHVCDCVFCE